MNFFTNNVCFVLCTLMLVICSGESRNSDSQDLDQLLTDDRFVSKQIGCVLGRSRCDEFGKNIKASIPKVITGECKSCTPEEAETARKLISFVKQYHPDVWDQVQQKYAKRH